MAIKRRRPKSSVKSIKASSSKAMARKKRVTRRGR